MKLLSIAISYHDSNITYYDGQTTRYFKSERLAQIKHHKLKTLEELNSVLRRVFNICLEEMDYICVCGVQGAHPKSVVEVLKDLIPRQNVFCVEHHVCHSLSSTMFLEQDADLSIVIDGQGHNFAWKIFKNDLELEAGVVDVYGSIGHGVVVLAKEMQLRGHDLDLAGKLMGLQSYGKVDLEFLKFLQKFNIYNVAAKIIRENYELPPKYISDGGMFDYAWWESYNKGAPKLDWARTVHERCCEIILDLFAKYAKPNDTIAYSGGVAQNVLWNTALKKQYPNLHIVPHVGDEGLSLGGIEYLRKKLSLPQLTITNFPFSQMDESTSEISSATIEKTALALAQGKVVAWYQGSGEIGPRALGHRCVLVDPRISNAKDIINSIKNRETFRPFGASILSEFKKEYFDLDFENPYMLYVGHTRVDGLESITHVDGTCRIQTVETTDDPFSKLLKKFYEITGCPVLLNTSLNMSGKPIAGNINDAISEYTSKNIDVLVIGDNYREK